MRFTAIIFGFINPIPAFVNFYSNEEIEVLNEKINEICNNNTMISFTDTKNRIRLFSVSSIKKIIIK